MPTPEQIQKAIQQTTDQQSFIQGLLQEALSWPIPKEVGGVEDIAYAWSSDDLKAEGLKKRIVDGQIWQVQPFDSGLEQPWGIFVLEFKHEDAFVAGRGLTGPLRKVLRGLVPKRRRQSNLPAWNRENLLFICTHRYRHFRFAYFKNPEGPKTAPLVTFGWGPGTPARTACEFNLPSLVWPADPGETGAWLAQWRGAFDKDRLTKDFFSTFTSLYYSVVEDVQATPELTDEAGRLAQLLLDRLLFLYFIQRKGWLNQEKDYLYSRFLRCDAEDPDGHSYYSTVLYPLFLRLSNAGFVAESVGDVPFLNGGLFEERCRQSQKQEVAHARLRIKNSTFRLLFSQLLERFNFTVTEDTPLDIEVAIDPEMLGRIFESLILQLEQDPDKDLRRLTGSYYTPRSIVHFMCQEAIKEYLVNHMAGHDQESIDSWRDRLGELLDLDQAEQMNQDQLDMLQRLFTPTEAKVLSQAILDCRVCDPAVGSGAFLVGMLHEMVAAKGRLDFLVHGRRVLGTRNYYYDIKKQVIESCLYGVDIQEQAVRLCELRLWLSLVVDYEIDQGRPFAKAIREIPSLPNLSYRIVRGDSLLERLFGHIVQLDVMAKDQRTRQLIESIQADKQAYFRESNNEEKQSLELKVLAKQADLAERLIEAKETAAGVQTDFWGTDAIPSRAQKEKEKEEARKKEWVELKAMVAKAKAEIERLGRHKGNVDRGDLDTLRRQYFHTGDRPTFLWHMDFAEVFSGGTGFDIVVSNPPYVRIQTLNRTSPEEVTWFRKTYVAAAKGNYDLYVVFVERSLHLLAPDGHLAFILPHKFFNAQYGRPLRGLLAEGRHVRRVIHFGDQQVFPGATNYVCLLFLSRGGADVCRWARADDLPAWLATQKAPETTLPAARVTAAEWNFAVGEGASLFEKLQRMPVKLGDVADIFVGLQTSADDVFIMNFVSETAKTITLESKSLGCHWTFEKELLHPLVSGTDVSPYASLGRRQFILFPYSLENGMVELLPLKTICDSWPHTAEYLKKSRQRLEGRESRRLAGTSKWHGYIYLKNMHRQERAKLCVPRLVEYLHATADFNGTHFLDNVDVGGVTFRLSSSDSSLAYLLALLNSRLLRWYFPHVSAPFRGGFRSANRQFLSLIPFCPLDLTVLSDRKEHDMLVDLADRILSAKHADSLADTSSLEQEIDRRVYALYGLTDEEIRIVENAGPSMCE